MSKRLLREEEESTRGRSDRGGGLAIPRGGEPTHSVTAPYHPTRVASAVAPVFAYAASGREKAAAAHGCDFLDAPVSGGAPGAASASLTFMVGSDSDAAFAAATPFFTQMGKPPVRCGSVGAGLAVKLANNLALSLQMLATAEGLCEGCHLTYCRLH